MAKNNHLSKVSFSVVELPVIVCGHVSPILSSLLLPSHDVKVVAAVLKREVKLARKTNHVSGAIVLLDVVEKALFILRILCNRRATHDNPLQVVQLSGTKNTMNVFIKVPLDTLAIGIKTTTAYSAAIHLAQRLVYELSQTNPLTTAELLTLLDEPCLVLSSSLRSFLYHLDTSQASIVSITISDKVDSLLSQHEPNTYQSRSTINYSNHTKQHKLIKQLTQSTKD